MRKLLIAALLLNAVLLFVIWQELSVVAKVSGGAGGSPCDTDFTSYSLDANGDGLIGVSDFTFGLNWFFNGTEAPRVCLATTDLETRVAALEGGAQPIDGFTFVETNAGGHPEYTHDSSGIRFVRLPGGSFNMGSPASEAGHSADEGPVHTASLSAFLIARYEVTEEEWDRVMGGASTSKLPQVNVSWDDLHAPDGFLERTGLSLPSEAQWEYACRAGTPGPYAGTGNLDDMGWYSSNSGDQPHDVGTKQPNQFGLHDLHGNVWEWCEDVYKSDFYSDEVPGFDPLSTSGSSRVIRGGRFDRPAVFCRSAIRLLGAPQLRLVVLGFRPAVPLP